MATRLADLCRLIDATLVGDGEILIEGAAPLDRAGANEITLVDHRDKVAALQGVAAAVAPYDSTPGNVPLLLVKDLHAAFGAIVSHFRPSRLTSKRGVSARAFVSPTACLGPNVTVHPGATIDDDVTVGANCVIHSGVRIMAGTRLGEDVTLFPNVVLYENTQVGSRVTIHAGAVIGGYGFGYKQVSGHHERTAQLGNVEIEADVEIGAATTIDRGTYGPTVIGEGTKIDNLVQIGHNCRIGRHNLICSQAGIAGSSSTGDYVVLAGQVGVSDHVHVGSQAVLCAKAGISNDVDDGEVLFGYPAIPLRQARRSAVVYAKLPELQQQLRALTRQLEELRGGGASEKPGDRHAA